MAKRKKLISTKESNSFNYNGEITVSLIKNNKVYKSKTYHNNGRWPLFKFFSECLAGNFKNALPYRPQYLVLFSAADKGQLVPVIGDNPGEKSIAEYTVDGNRMSAGLIQVVENPKINVTENKIGSSDINLHFEIPFSYLVLKPNIGGVTKWKPINLLTLYCANYTPSNSENLSQPSTFAFISQVDNTLGDLLGDLNIESDQSNYSLKIDWKLAITN